MRPKTGDSNVTSLNLMATTASEKASEALGESVMAFGKSANPWKLRQLMFRHAFRHGIEFVCKSMVAAIKVFFEGERNGCRNNVVDVGDVVVLG